MEAMGYAQTTDSTIEGHPADMIFLPQANSPWPEVWVEAKATKLSLGNSEFVDEVRAYLRQWLFRTPQTRFKFMIFARQLSNLSRWESIWGNSLSPEHVLGWLTEGLDETEASLFTESASLKDVVSFFAETGIVEGTDLDLIDTANEKRKVVMTANEIRQRARHQLELMAQRSRPVRKKSDLLSNLLQFDPPGSYILLGIDPISLPEIMSRMKGRNYPPYRILEKGELLTFDTPDAEAHFAALNAVRQRVLNLQELNKTYPDALAQLVNSAIWRLLRPLGVGTSYNYHYFLAGREAAEERDRSIRISSRDSMRVARPLFLPEKEESFPAKRRLNFVYHQGFRIRYRNLWGQHFIEIGLSKMYTKDGITVIDGTRASKIDARFRNPNYDRSETRQRKRTKLAEYIFRSRGHADPKWFGLFRFGRFLRVQTDWTPDSVPIDQAMMDDYEEEASNGDFG